MAGQAQTANAAAKKVTQPAFTMQSLCRIALWGTTAATALLVAILTSRSDAGSQRIATTPGATHGAPRQFDAEFAARQLTQAVRGLTEDRDRLITRLAALEHSLGDITGAIAGQSEKATPPAAQGTTQTGNRMPRQRTRPKRARPERMPRLQIAPPYRRLGRPAICQKPRWRPARLPLHRCAAVRRIAVPASRHFRRAIAEASDVSPDGRG
jgi:hypothetical protein